MAGPDWQERWRSLLGRIKVVATDGELEAEIQALAKVTQPHVLAFVNAHAMNCVADSEPFYRALAGADTLLRDGVGMEWLFRLKGMRAGLNANGTDLIPKLLPLFDGWPVALYGTDEPALSNAAQRIGSRLVPGSVVTRCDGFRDVAAYVALACEELPAVIVLGMGMPKQEYVAAELRLRLQHPCLIVCGGAILDFLGGRMDRAPSWMRQAKLEWVYRLVQEPRRLFRRYVVGNPLFLWRALWVGVPGR